MYDAVAGKILSGGGAPSYELSDALTNSHITTINEASGVAEVKQIKGLNRARIFGDGVILPTGHVLTTGGMQWGKCSRQKACAIDSVLLSPHPLGC